MPSPASRRSSPVLFIVIGVAIASLVGLNIMQQNNDPAFQEKIAREAEREAAKKAAKQNEVKTKDPKEAQEEMARQGPANELVTYGAEKMLGSSNGKHKVTIGWLWTPEVQGNPALVYNAIQMAKTELPDATVRVVNLDAKPGAVPPGLAVDGTVMTGLTPDGGIPVIGLKQSMEARQE